MPAPEGACEQAMAWLSAQHDSKGRDDPRLAAHAADCPACTRLAAGLARLDARIAAAPAPAVPEGVLAPALAAWAGRAPAGSGAELAGRLVLALAGCTGIALAVTALVALGGAAQGGQAAVHYGRDLLGFTLAFAVAFLLASRRPGRYGRPLLPITAAAGLFVLLLSTTEMVTGTGALLVEVGHLTVLAGLFGLLLLQGGRGGAARRALPSMAE